MNKKNEETESMEKMFASLFFLIGFAFTKLQKN